MTGARMAAAERPRVVSNWPHRGWRARLPGSAGWGHHGTWHAAILAVGLWRHDRLAAPVGDAGG